MSPIRVCKSGDVGHSVYYYNLAAHDDNKVLIAREGGIAVVLEAMRGHVSDLAVQERGCGALGYLAVNADNKVLIAREGGIAVVLEAMRAHASHSGVWGCWALFYLAENDAGNKVQIAREGGIAVVLEAMRGHVSDLAVQERGCGALGYLAVNADNKVLIAREGGIAVVLEAMRAHASHSGVWGCWALFYLAENDAGNKVQIAREGGIAVVLEAMRAHVSHWGVQEWGGHALRCLNNNGP